MPDLGKKHECFSCRTKFYSLGKPEAICPKCGANQKDARAEEAPPPAPRPPRRSAIMMEPAPEESPNEFGEEGPAAEEEEVDPDDEEDEEITESGRGEEEY